MSLQWLIGNENVTNNGIRQIMTVQQYQDKITDIYL